MFAAVMGYAGDDSLREVYDELIRIFDESLDITYNLSQGIKDERYETSLIEDIILSMKDDSPERKEEKEWYKSWAHAWHLEGSGMEKYNGHLAEEREKLSKSQRGREIMGLIDKIQAFYKHVQEGRDAQELLQEVGPLIKEYKTKEKLVVQCSTGDPHIISDIREKELFLLSYEGRIPASKVCGMMIFEENGVKQLKMQPTLNDKQVSTLGIKVDEHTSIKDICQEIKAKNGRHALPYVLRMKQAYGLMSRQDAEELEQYVKSLTADSDSQRKLIAYETLENYYALGNTNIISSYEDWIKAAHIYLQHKPSERKNMQSLYWYEYQNSR